MKTLELLDSLGVCPSNKVRVIYNGVVIPERIGPELMFIKNRSHRTILFPNRLFSYKNPILFIEACADVCRILKDVRIVVCGWGDLEKAMKDRCNELGIMQYCDFLGSILPENIPYKEADLVVNCSSSREGMSNTLMEALAHGVPVVATDVAGSSELLNNHDFGRLIPVNDKGALVAAMCDMLSVSKERRETLGEEAREYMTREFSIERLVDEHIRFYNKVLTENLSKRTKSALA
jgi:glycosyltransferase involved in cell wall biosynthesis